MPYTKEEIKKIFETYIAKGKGAHKEWYIGVSKDAKSCLFKTHRVLKKGDWWLYRQAHSSDTAKNIKTYFIELGVDGAPGGGDEKADWVYLYKKNDYTEP